jgi:hypothetical protein
VTGVCWQTFTSPLSALPKSSNKKGDSPSTSPGSEGLEAWGRQCHQYLRAIFVQGLIQRSCGYGLEASFEIRSGKLKIQQNRFFLRPGFLSHLRSLRGLR